MNANVKSFVPNSQKKKLKNLYLEKPILQLKKLKNLYLKILNMFHNYQQKRYNCNNYNINNYNQNI